METTVVAHWMEDGTDKIGHLVLTEFNRKSEAQLDKALTDLENQGMRALVLDLRFNPGGLLDAAIDVASLFIPDNSKPQLHNNAVIIRQGDGEEEGLTLEPLPVPHRHVPLAVLVNGSSASAAEIVTAAIRDYEAGAIVGERTFGKGKVQTLFEMNHGRDGGIRLTTSLYYPPKHYDINFKHDELGNRIAGTGGIVPDIEVQASPAWHGNFDDKTDDNQLRAAVQFLKARLAGRSTGEATRIALGK
jgi:carboxyl-terminal processing protease